MVKKQIWVVLLGTVICFLLAACNRGEEYILVQEEKGTEAEVSLEKNEGPLKPDALVYVYVCGAVQQPGVVALPEGSRTEAALEAAGGFAENAGRDKINLAAKVRDGEKIYVPGMEEPEADSGEALMVDINAASAEELCNLPGIGASRAQDIIDYREKNGPFTQPEDITLVPGIKSSVYEKIKDRIVVY